MGFDWTFGLKDVVGGALDLIGIGSARQSEKADRKWQLRSATEGIRWRVQDAKAAGIHPLAALGANIPQMTPIRAGDPGYSKMGQNLNYNLNQSLNRKLVQAEIKSKENLADLYASQAALATSQTMENRPRVIFEQDLGSMGVGPPYDHSYPGHTDVDTPGVQPGTTPQQQKTADIHGIRRLLPSEKYGEALEQSIPHQALNTVKFIWDQAGHSDAWMVPVSKNGREKRKLLYTIQDYLFKKDGIWYAYNIKWDQWHPVDTVPRYSRLYYNQRKIHGKLALDERGRR